MLDIVAHVTVYILFMTYKQRVKRTLDQPFFELHDNTKTTVKRRLANITHTNLRLQPEQCLTTGVKVSISG